MNAQQDIDTSHEEMLAQSIRFMYRDIKQLSLSPDKPLCIYDDAMYSYSDVKNDVEWIECGSFSDTPLESLRGTCARFGIDYKHAVSTIADELEVVKNRIAITEKMLKSRHDRAKAHDALVANAKADADETRRKRREKDARRRYYKTAKKKGRAGYYYEKRDRNDLICQMKADGKSYREISDATGCLVTKINDILRRRNLHSLIV